MTVRRIAKVAVEKTQYHFDQLFDYFIPDNLAEQAVPGCRVTVPFGGANHHRQGVIFECAEVSDFGTLKPLVELLDHAPSVSKELLKLACWMHDRYFCTYFEAVKIMLPTGLNIRYVCSYAAAEYITERTLEKLEGLTLSEKRIMQCLLASRTAVERDKILELVGLSEGSNLPERLVRKKLIVRYNGVVRNTSDAVIKMVRLLKEETPEDGSVRVTKKHREIINLLSTTGNVSVKELCALCECSMATIRTMAKNGIVEIYEQETYRRPEQPELSLRTIGDLKLTEEQQHAYESLRERYFQRIFTTTLLYGITGSGKTSVFMRLIDDVIDDGRDVIVMVPEIALTPQTLERFRNRYGDRVAIFHSGLSLGQRMDEWKRVKEGKASIAVGTRSAVFAPFDNIGLIVIDEEQESTYKSEAAPRFHARDVARFRAAYSKATLLLASATPSLESYYLATETKQYFLEKLENRYGNAALPDVEIVDISEQRTGMNLISPQMYDAIKSNLENGYQSILLHNRRGYHTFVSCRACGHVLTCSSCSVSMTYHYDRNRLYCHYCGESAPFTTVCPNCGAEQLRYAGQGTQRVQDELERLFPQARILRMDADTTVSRTSYADNLNAFARGDYDIMLGTQMVAKGLDFERVTLVGVVMADQMLNGDDFRSYERAFSLLTQVVGRSGRGGYRGRAIIQTLAPENSVIDMAKRQDYLEFFRNEIKMRKTMLYPPFSDICVLCCSGRDESLTKEMANAFLLRLKELVGGEFRGIPLRVLGPTAATVVKVKGKYYYKLIIKCRNTEQFRSMICRLLKEVSAEKRFSAVQAYVDMNPFSIM